MPNRTKDNLHRTKPQPAQRLPIFFPVRNRRRKPERPPTVPTRGIAESPIEPHETYRVRPQQILTEEERGVSSGPCGSFRRCGWGRPSDGRTSARCSGPRRRRRQRRKAATRWETRSTWRIARSKMLENEGRRRRRRRIWDSNRGGGDRGTSSRC